MIPVDALLFDLDGTLIDSRLDLANSVRHIQQRYGLPPSSNEEVSSYIGDGVAKLIERALPRLSVGERRAAVEQFKRYYRRHCLEHTRAYAGVREVLFHYRSKALAVVTNKPVAISRRILDGLGLLSRFQIVVGGDSLRSKKPKAGPVLFALRSMRIHERRRAVMVGDGENDVRSGRAAGLYTCGVLSNIGKPAALRASHPDFLLHNLRELTNWCR